MSELYPLGKEKCETCETVPGVDISSACGACNGHGHLWRYAWQPVIEQCVCKTKHVEIARLDGDSVKMNDCKGGFEVPTDFFLEQCSPLQPGHRHTVECETCEKLGLDCPQECETRPELELLPGLELKMRGDLMGTGHDYLITGLYKRASK